MAAVSETSAKLRRLEKRAQFLRVARGKRAGNRVMTLQAAHTSESTAGIGFTVTRRVGNAPERNRIKRRLRAAADACADRFKPQHDYVIIGRRAALSESFTRLVSGLESLIGRVHANRPTASGTSE